MCRRGVYVQKRDICVEGGYNKPNAPRSLEDWDNPPGIQEGILDFPE